MAFSDSGISPGKTFRLGSGGVFPRFFVEICQVL